MRPRAPEALARLAELRHDERVQWAGFGLQCFGSAATFLIVLWWVTSR